MFGNLKNQAKHRKTQVNKQKAMAAAICDLEEYKNKQKKDTAEQKSKKKTRKGMINDNRKILSKNKMPNQH